VRLFWIDKEAEGVKYLESAVRLDPSFASAYRYLGWTYLILGNSKASNEAYERAKALSFKATEKERLLIEAFTASDIDKRFGAFQEIIQKYPKEKEAYFQIAVHYRLFKKMDDEAIPYLNKTIELDPSFGYAYFHLSDIYADKGNYQKAMEYFDIYESLKPNDPDPLIGIAELYWEMGKQEEALKREKEILEIDPGNLLALEDLANYHAYREEYRETMKWVDKFIEQAPPNKKARGYLLKVLFYYWVGDSGNYVIFADKTKKSAEESEDDFAKGTLLYLNGFFYNDQGDIDKARGEFRLWRDLWLKILPEYAAWFESWFSFTLGIIELRQGNIGSSQSALLGMNSQLDKIDAQFKGWHAYFHGFLAGEIQIAQNLPEKAIATVEAASFREYIHDLPLIWVVFHNIPLYKDGLARAYQQMGNLDKAIAEYEKLLIYSPKKKDNFLIHPKYHYRLGMLYEQKGLKGKAVEQYQKFLDLWKDADPGTPEVEDARKRLAGLKG
jgi:tetratricopeptide (TPR) repeat protein